MSAVSMMWCWPRPVGRLLLQRWPMEVFVPFLTFKRCMGGAGAVAVSDWEVPPPQCGDWEVLWKRA